MLLNIVEHYTNDHSDFDTDTYFVESFNNTLNINENKRIVLGYEQYKIRTDHWNENVNRKFTSIGKQNKKNHRLMHREKP